ncbi:MAG: acyl-CoA dehydrogenase family protein [Deltaproteobacteria bacterium]|nr:acyl-CoA dehydrogenase family protein [Deltaproteobacteria bacterium]
MKPDFVQEFPPPPDLYAVDRALHAELARRLPKEVMAKVGPRFEAVGKASAGELAQLVNEADAQPPVHVPFGPFGRRIDEIRTSRAWEAMRAFSATHGIVAAGYDQSLGEHRRVVQAALLHLFSASSAIYSCPLAMTDAATRVLLDLAPPALRDRLVPRLTSTNPASFITSGQWMTERTGGSDVSDTSTVARPLGGDRYALSGVKWFTSAVTAEMALALARIEDDGKMVMGSKGLTLFVVDVERKPEGGLKNIVINRLKDKLGTKALPTAEIELQGVVGYRIGEVGRGVANIAGMLNITRFYNSIASASVAHKAQAWARAYSQKRVALGASIAASALHARTLDDMEAETAGVLALCMEVASLMGRAEAGVATDDEKRRLRALIPLTKATTGKQAVVVASEAIEVFGGAGYCEDTGLPVLLRDAQVLPIWEGTTNVLSLDVLRAEKKAQAYSAVLADLTARTEKLPAALPKRGLEALRGAVAALRALVTESMKSGSVEVNARKIGLTTGYCMEAMLLGENAAFGGADGGARFERFALVHFER